jgi:pyridoxine 5-phosphate synthase
MEEIHLGVNVDHVATVRQARGTSYPSVIEAAQAAERGGASGITAHLREDRRHIQDSDIEALQHTVATKLNLEMAVSDEIVALAARVRPADACIVPERREELTTEGGLAVAGNVPRIAAVVERLAAAGIRVSLFIDPDPREIDATLETGATVIELHTGTYAGAPRGDARDAELTRIADATVHAESRGLSVNAGHGLARSWSEWKPPRARCLPYAAKREA